MRLRSRRRSTTGSEEQGDVGAAAGGDELFVRLNGHIGVPVASDEAEVLAEMSAARAAALDDCCLREQHTPRSQPNRTDAEQQASSASRHYSRFSKP